MKYIIAATLSGGRLICVCTSLVNIDLLFIFYIKINPISQFRILTVSEGQELQGNVYFVTPPFTGQSEVTAVR